VIKPKTHRTKLEPSNVNVRIKLSALWTSMLFVFAYVDLFSLYRPDFRADVEAGEIWWAHRQPGVPPWNDRLYRHPQPDGVPLTHPATTSKPNRQHCPERHVRPHHHRWRDRRVELLHPRQRYRGHGARGHRLLQLDLADGSPTDLDDLTDGENASQSERGRGCPVVVATVIRPSFYTRRRRVGSRDVSCAVTPIRAILARVSRYRSGETRTFTLAQGPRALLLCAGRSRRSQRCRRYCFPPKQKRGRRLADVSRVPLPSRSRSAGHRCRTANA